ncbi:MAG: hypothetical protein GY932_07955, partial [Arcobacter sp.]|nr:hypothetical protein [Arcobacter sp.]
LNFGTKFRLPTEIDFDAIESEILAKCVIYIEKLSVQKHLCFDKFDKYYSYFKKMLGKKILQLKNRGLSSNKTINLDRFSNLLKLLRNKFIITPLDKASNNYGFTCKKFYCMILANEVGLDAINNISPYVPYTNSHQNIANLHFNLIKFYNLGSVPDEFSCLPKIYLLPKIHKNPTSFRNIAGAFNSSLKPILMLAHKILKFLKKHFINYCNTIKSLTGINHYWSILDCNEAVFALKNSGKIREIYTGDFATLYTNLEHHVIKENLFYLIDLLFKNSHKPYLTCDNNSLKYGLVFYSNENLTCRKRFSFTPYDLKDFINVCLDENYVTFAGIIYKQIKGVPMGGNASPLIADLCLSIFEFKYIKTNKEKFRGKNVVRYIDDILAINFENFSQVASEIYPSSIPLNKTNLDNKKAEYLDIEISVDQNLTFKLFNKTDKYNFKVIRYTKIFSNISSNTVLGVFKGELVRVTRRNNTYCHLEEAICSLFKSFLDNGVEFELLIKAFSDFAIKYQQLLLQYGVITSSDLKKWILHVYKAVYRKVINN